MITLDRVTPLNYKQNFSEGHNMHKSYYKNAKMISLKNDQFNLKIEIVSYLWLNNTEIYFQQFPFTH